MAMGHNCVPNKDGADFPPVLESDHTIAVVQGALRPTSGRAAYLKAADSLARAAGTPDSPQIPDSPAAFRVEGAINPGVGALASPANGF